MAKFHDKRVLITGGGTGIGRELVHRFLSEGARVVACGRRPGPLVSLQQEHAPLGPRLLTIECDICDPQDVAAMAKRVDGAMGGLDVLVNNAGVEERGKLDDLELRAWDRVMNVNLRGTFLVTQEFLPLLRKAGRGANVLNLSSSLGSVAEEGTLAYSVSKAGLEMMTRCCALDYAREGIRFNALAPGIIDTPMQDRSKGELGYQEWRSQMEQLHPLQSIGMPKDVSAAALFLCSAEADWITGVILPVDGGISAR